MTLPKFRRIAGLIAFCGAIVATSATQAQTPFITVASTTSTKNSGLFDALLPVFEKRHGIAVRVVAVGTGQAIRLAQNGDADILFVHHLASEEKFIADGFGVKRYGVMHNDFVLVGPKDDPAKASSATDISDALIKIATSKAPFVSRGDDSGTHKKERGLWAAAQQRQPLSRTSGTWYRETGSGMGATLNTASAMNAYTLSDRGTWISFKNKGDLAVAFDGDKGLNNPYGVILVNQKRHPHVKAKLGQTFIDWLMGDEGQAAIGAYKIAGQQLFFPDAR